MHYQSKERNMSKSQKKKKKKKFARAIPFELARFRFNEVRINEVPLYCDQPSSFSQAPSAYGVQCSTEGLVYVWSLQYLGKGSSNL